MKKFAHYLSVISVAIAIFAFYGSTYRTLAEADDISPAYYYLEAVPGEAMDSVSLRLKMNTGGRPVNAVRTVITYDPAMVEAVQLQADGPCEIFLEQIIDNDNGRLVLSCGVPNPGFSGDGELAEFIFSVKQKGWTDFAFDNGTMMLANDGYATDIMEMSFGKVLITE